MELLPERRIIEVLEGSEPQGFEGVVWRHMFGARPVDTPNTGGARWNPPDCETLYTALTRDTALAEGNYASEAFGIPPRVQRYLYQIRVSLNAVADLTAASTLEALGLSADDITSASSD